MLSTIIKLSSLTKHTGLLNELTHEQACNIATEASKQGVAGWILERLKTDYQSEQGYEILKNELFKQTIFVHLKNQENISIINEIYRLLNAENIEVVLLKGAALMTSYYSDISLRPIGDIDIWVGHNDVYRAHKILKQISTNRNDKTFRTYVLQESIRTHLPELHIDGQVVELHYNMYSPDSLMNPKDNIAHNLIVHGKFTLLNDVMLLYHLTTHILKNRATLGVRIGWIVDIVMLFEKWGGEKSAQTCMAAMQQNERVAAKMLLIWRYVVSLTSENISNKICSILGVSELPIDASHLLSTNEGYKHGLRMRLRAIRTLFVATYRSIAEVKGISAKTKRMRDILYDIHNRYNYQ